MKLRCNLSTLMGTKRLTIQDVHIMTNLSRTTIANLYYDRATRIDYNTIIKLCKIFECEVNSLLELEKDCEDKNKQNE